MLFYTLLIQKECLFNSLICKLPTVVKITLGDSVIVLNYNPSKSSATS